MTRLLLTASALAAAIAVAAGPTKAPPTTEPEVAPCVCKSDADGGTRPKPHGLLMVADLASATPCVQGG
jgi:hypothetical protein